MPAAAAPSGHAADHERPITATYRLQLNADFTFADVRARIDYLERLGVSHLYFSPVLAAKRGSRHGYDVIDPCRVNSELGTEEDLRGLADDLHARGMGIVLDIVPNHMSASAENPYWDDVLRRGERSRYAPWFDIDWDADASGRRKVVIPVLGDELDQIVSRGELTIQLRDGEPRVAYFSHNFPLDPATLPPELQLAQFDPEGARELASSFSSNHRDKLAALLQQQHYRLVFWKRGPREINYRRFFEVTELVAVRSHEPEVFNATHALVLRLVNDRVIDGLRVDHVDGLVDPRAYLDQLRSATPPGTFIVVEKILGQDERLRRDWPVQGTTGYEFLNDLENVFLDPAGAAEIERFYRRMRRLGNTTFEDVARTSKRRVLEGAFAGELDRLAAPIARAARAAGHIWDDATVRSSVAAFVAGMPVYRTYLDASEDVDEQDRRAIETAAADAVRSGADSAVVELIASLLLGRAAGVDGGTRLCIARRFQALTSPVAAKGVEDTAFYVYVPVTSRAEVGGEPDEPLQGSVRALHRANAERARDWPMSLLATNTHDTKRSADVRARLDALTELAPEWERSVRRWRKLNAKHRRVVNGRLAPDTNTEYLMYQTIVALWPPPRAGRRADDLPDRGWREAARDRLTAYAIKAAREAKTRTSWIEPNSAYEQALSEFVARILEPGQDAPFLTDVARLVWLVAPLGAANSLARIAVHLTAPGVPDVYQGDEIWNFTLVDPDNRREVDFDVRERVVGQETDDRPLPDDPFDNRLKALVTQRLLTLRRKLPMLFSGHGYQPIEVVGTKKDRVIAFARILDGKAVLTVCSRLTGSGQKFKSAQWWSDTAIMMPHNMSNGPWVDAIARRSFQAPEGRIAVADIVGKLPVAVLVN